MSKINLYMQMSLDGVVSDPEKWMTLSDEMTEDSLSYYDTLEAIIVGGRSYPGLASYWQDAENTSESEIERRFAKKINDIKKIVISRSDVDLVWRNSELIKVADTQSLAKAVDQLKQRGTKDFSVESGAKIWQLFIQNSLFDKILVCVHPVVASTGEKLFADINDKMSVQLSDTKIYKNGVINLIYKKA